MQVNLTQKQLEEVIQALEKEPEQVDCKFSTLNYLRIVKQMSTDCLQSVDLDDIPF